MNNQNLSIDALKESLRMINACLEKGNKAGAYTLDEAYVVKVALSNVTKAVEALETVKNQNSMEAQD